MGQVKNVRPVKLFIGMLFSQASVMEEACKKLSQKYGAIDQESPCWEFGFTQYYADEMGNSLFRKFISFESLIAPEGLCKIKLYTNEMESCFSNLYAPPSRPINLDPGYLSMSKIILATTKDYSHRVYLGDGIFGEVTLYYYRKSFTAWDWTYPDYKTSHYLQFFETIRDIYKRQLDS